MVMMTFLVILMPIPVLQGRGPRTKTERVVDGIDDELVVEPQANRSEQA